MARFREFYVPAGAGSNFLASKCLWADTVDSMERHSNSLTNEHFFDREKIGKSVTSTLDFECDDEDLISAGKRIKPILIELGKIIESISSDDDLSRSNYRADVIRGINELWRIDVSFQRDSFVDHILPEMFPNNTIPPEVLNKKIQAEDYFAQCREYYFKVCEMMNWDSFKITHMNPYDSISPRLKLPKDFKSLVVSLDSETNMVIGALQDIKSNNYDPNGYTHKVGTKLGKNFRCVEFADDSVSYRKIFIENDRYEVMKMYEFFDNKAYFHSNRQQIMKEFKEYHDNNMAVIKKFTPRFYERIK